MKNPVLNDSGAPRENELELINKFTRRNLSADEVYVFSVTLCDNEIDRDFERFTIDALKKLAELFVGKTGIFDHTNRGQDQCARIFSCEVQQDEKVKTKNGEVYHRLNARAYMPRTQKNKELILEIDAGIKKEVSVGCSISLTSCSICGAEAGQCTHKKGRFYKKSGVRKQCFFELSNPTDAYEWSFVAVPAQPKAGVTKSYKQKEKYELNANEIVKSVKENEFNVELSSSQIKTLIDHIDTLSDTVESASEYLRGQKKMIIKNLCDSKDEKLADLINMAFSKMSTGELLRFYNETMKTQDSAVTQLKKPCSQKANNELEGFIV
ncbi:MAG: hypothetical protein Q4B04_00840 [bacterium]|nr:hypothetical protein [bacterium]